MLSNTLHPLKLMRAVDKARKRRDERQDVIAVPRDKESLICALSNLTFRFCKGQVFMGAGFFVD
jgi:hypothetical protein